MYPEIFLGRLVHTMHPKQRLKFASAVGKCQDFCQGISPFYSICLGNKNPEAVKFLKIKKKSFPRTKKGIFFFFSLKFFFFKMQMIHVHLYSIFIPSFHIFLTHYSSVLNRSSFLKLYYVLH